MVTINTNSWHDEPILNKEAQRHTAERLQSLAKQILDGQMVAVETIYGEKNGDRFMRIDYRKPRG